MLPMLSILMPGWNPLGIHNQRYCHFDFILQAFPLSVFSVPPWCGCLWGISHDVKPWGLNASAEVQMDPKCAVPDPVGTGA